jgi:signal transduction histidine kinase
MLTGDQPSLFMPSRQANLLKARCQGAQLARDPWLNALCRTMSEPLVVLNEDRRVVKASRALLEMIGLTNDTDLIGSSLDLREPQVCRQREEHVQVDGADFWLVTILDRRDEEHRRALERVFLHDLLNTAGGVQGLSEVMIEAGPADMDSLKTTVRHLADQLVDEITSQRDFLAAESGDLLVEPRPVVAGEVAGMVAQRYRNHPVTGDRQVFLAGPRHRLQFRTDPTVLARVLGNMLKNALEASPDGAVVTLDYGRRDGRSMGATGQAAAVWFSIHNPGFIPVEAQPFIFTRAFSTKGAGRGLGTYGMKLLCERFLGGRVDFRSHPADGTVFTVTLPFDGPCR